MPFLDVGRLENVGFKKVGREVKISDRCSIYNPQNISLGDFTRIDDYCILSAGKDGIDIGSYVHIACYCSLQGEGIIVLQDFVNLSSRIAIYSSSDDFSGESLTNPTIPDRYRNVISGPVIIERHVIIGAGSVVLPGVRIGTGAAIGAMSFVKTGCDPFGMYAGIPARKVKDRSRRLLELEKALREETVDE